MKRLVSYLLLVSLLLSTAGAALSGFSETRAYAQGQFADVPTDAWYAESVAAAFRLGIIDGKSAARFDPDGSLTVSETVKLACALHAAYFGNALPAAGAPWYRVYVDYALEHGILTGEYASYDAPALRADFAILFARALPADALSVINTVEDGAIPDVPTASGYADAVYLLYRAGVLTGSDARGSFRPGARIARSEAAAIVARMCDPALRRAVTLSADTALSAAQVFALCAPAVFYLEVYDAAGRATASGSGFFLSADGRAVTNYHVIKDAYAAKVFTQDGKTCDVSGMYGGDATVDLAVLQVAGRGFSTLVRGDSQGLSTGASVFAIGSPLGLDSTISEGIVSYASRAVNGKTYIQTTAPISPGSSGGALIDAAGRVVGVTSGSVSGGESLNLAVPIHKLDALTLGALTALPKGGGNAYYSGWAPVPDYGAFSGAPVAARTEDEDGVTFAYRVVDLTCSAEEAVRGYVALLEENGFTYAGKRDGILLFHHAARGLSIAFGALQNYTYLFVSISRA